MVLTQQEMRRRAEIFIEDYKDVSDERSYSQLFWRDFFDIFGIRINDVAVFEQAVKKFSGTQGFIDCFWKGKLVIEHKSRGKNLSSAFTQALGYLDTLSSLEKPRYIIVSDFYKIRLIDLFLDKKTEIVLDDLVNNIQLFSFIYEDKIEHHQEQEELNIEAAELMGKLYDSLKKSKYDGRELELLLIRILFCVYAEDTGIFKPYQFYDYIANEEDPTTVGIKIQMLFRILNQDYSERQNNLSEDLSNFPYVNGKLFEEPIIPPNFDYKMYSHLKDICKFDWSTISPAIFGSLFQSIMDEEKRRNLGAHYTSESNIIKVINSLFMNDLWDEFHKSKRNYKKLQVLIDKISQFKFFDPACGCGNFLIVAYRELRLLEYEILNILLDEDKKQSRFSSNTLTKVKLDNFYGIEIEEFPSMIAKVAMWFVEHQMDLKYETLDIHNDNLPLKSSANIIHGNALRLNWEEILEPSNDVFIFGNPPFVGKQEQDDMQKEDLCFVFKEYDKDYEKQLGINFKRKLNIKLLDYVTAWYKKAVEYIQGTSIQVGYVSTSSICQGEQPAIIWDILNNDFNVKINFAHQSFKWSNEARKNAGVYVIIIGFALYNRTEKYIFTYESPTAIPKSVKANFINSYLIDSEDIILDKRRKPLSDVPPIVLGSIPIDGGNLILSAEDKNYLLANEPKCEKFIKPLVSAKEYLNNSPRYCLWLVNALPSELKELPLVLSRIDKVKEFRLASTRKQTRKKAAYASEFAEIRQPKTDYILIPLTTSENRNYVPIGFVDKGIIANNSASFIGSDDKFIFGLITSKMHMTWMRYVCGRFKGDYRYSNTLVYNNFPFPRDVSEKNIEKVVNKANNVLNVRNNFLDESLANLYNPLLMPHELMKAHEDLDNAVDKCYKSTKFKDDNDRMKFLFDLYFEYIQD